MRPLADRMRPERFDDLLGQDHLIGPGKPLRVAIERGDLHSMVFWGPPGSGKTTLALIIARLTNASFIPFSAVTATIKEVRKVMKEAKNRRHLFGKEVIVFIDEIHRFNKAQQDAFLPYLERGDIVLIGATTENPSFELIGPLLSRVRVYLLKPLGVEVIKKILRRALDRDPHLPKVEIKDEILGRIAHLSDGDGRVALNILEILCSAATHGRVTEKLLEEVVQRKSLRYDKKGEEHYNLISAFIKSLRGSDADAALYWLARMLEAGEDPRFIARRMVILASEDIGNADPFALLIAIAAKEAVDFVGRPECDLNLAQAAIYLARAPKSNEVLTALNAARDDALKTYAEPVPLHLRNPVTDLMKKLGYGKGYLYPHSHPEAKIDYLPKRLKGRRYLKKKR
ncbi:replication-associated recombination protein A [candidate division WOR-3 bacterium]|uniref:Replication-associated recombination protein A n=1 Tax=candidate division WOR-3 bacterium TaxID=2052148 RepID=A0A660SJV5_UNCW3|nr:MAG: replication-associated recombination protein A [candidate division WOR-3 bacterium]